MKTNLLNSLQGSIAHVPTLVIAMPDLLLAEMISEWQFNCNFRNLAVIEDGKDILRKLQNLKPDFLLIDSELPLFKGFDLAEKLKSLSITTKIIIYASKLIPDYLQKYLSGTNQFIQGFIHKGCGIIELECCLNEVFSGKKYLSNSLSKYMNETVQHSVENMMIFEKISSLAHRERDVWDLMTKGRTEKQIGESLCIGIATVKTYKKCIKEKLDFVGRGKLTYLALSNK